MAASLTLVGILPCAGTWSSAASSSRKASSAIPLTRSRFATKEGLLPAIALVILPFFILWGLVKLLPPWTDAAPPRQAS